MDRQADRIERLLAEMTLEEKVGQMWQANLGATTVDESFEALVAQGAVGSVINAIGREAVETLQRIATQRSRLGIPLLICRDVIHGFRTVFPLPLAQAAGFDEDLVARCAEAAAAEAAAAGIHMTFAPMLDIGRDPRWGRVAEGFGEDPVLAGRLGAAMVRGLQAGLGSARGGVAACIKHFAAYGAVEGGRDYAPAVCSRTDLFDVHLPPFRAAIEAGARCVMASFSEFEGVPATADPWLLGHVLREVLGFDGVVMSDWDAVRQLCVHGVAADEREAALLAIRAGIDIEMFGDAFHRHLPDLVRDGQVPESRIDESVRRILRLKEWLGLFEAPVPPPPSPPPPPLALCREAAERSFVLLRNEGDTLPLVRDGLQTVAVVGPLADAPREQLGTWIFDGDPALSVTPLAALREMLEPRGRVLFEPALQHSRASGIRDCEALRKCCHEADVVVLVLGEEAILSGEAHCRADITLPGSQDLLVRYARQQAQRLIGVVLAGRPLVLTPLLDQFDALLYAAHPGTMTGPALARILFGEAEPGGRLPASMPRAVGQIPINYARKNTGTPPLPETTVLMQDVPVGAGQDSFGMTSYHMDVGPDPAYPFGFGLGYGSVAYEALRLSSRRITAGQSLRIEVEVANRGKRATTEVVQLYIRDSVASCTRPVRELRDFARVHLAPGERRSLAFELDEAALAFCGRREQPVAEPGRFDLWVGPDATGGLHDWFELAG